MSRFCNIRLTIQEYLKVWCDLRINYRVVIFTGLQWSLGGELQGRMIFSLLLGVLILLSS